MSSRTVYTSTITVPVYASWKCEECGEINFASGVIVCSRQDSSGSWRSSKQREAKERAENLVKAQWAAEAFQIISDPNHSGSAMYSNLFMQNTSCTKCGKKPRWNKNTKFLPLVVLCIPVALFSIVAAIATFSVAAWLLFLASAGVIAWGIAREVVYKKMMPKLPQKYTPVIGSLNEELIKYAAVFRKTIPTPDECIAAVKAYDRVASPSIPNVQPTAGNAAFANNTVVPFRFCRKCGTQLPADSGFCHKCGTEVIKQ